jgi:hypothetical protein
MKLFVVQLDPRMKHHFYNNAHKKDQIIEIVSKLTEEIAVKINSTQFAEQDHNSRRIQNTNIFSKLGNKSSNI